MAWENSSCNSLSTVLLRNTKKNKINLYPSPSTNPLHANNLIKRLLKTSYAIAKIPYKQLAHFKLKHISATLSPNTSSQEINWYGFTPIYDPSKYNTNLFHLTGKNEFLV